MKKPMVYILLIMLLISVVSILKDNGMIISSYKTLEEALNRSKEEINVIHKENTDKGAIVFFNDNKDDKDLQVHYMKKTIFGRWQYVYGGVFGDPNDTAYRLGGVHASSFPMIRNTPFPMFQGVVNHPDIEKIKIIDVERDKEYDTKIVRTDSFTLWFNYEDDFKTGEYEIIGLSKYDNPIITLKTDVLNINE
ncbi:hypothetical protein GOQ27_10615 [Clostridium sp. D2Q-11]|uniref:Uncharacterized protein n=1 Tax=Anaeromonas frigoriresistens TaxID=2683708 RepID=A0A942UVP9_9FIRM|nr:hypothetical protein [Anaeromonas frigoriresistens]MBS4538920.1 hypothetical protein [Anaeromonas frigoriresistens]